MILLSSCKSQKLGYFHDIDATASGTVPVVLPSITIEPNDELLITVSSSVPEASAVFNLSSGMTLTSADLPAAGQQRLQTYIVNSQGDIQFPQLGKIHVAGLTVPELTDELTTRIEKYVEDPFVRVELVNFKVKVLGEVLKPGTVTVHTDRYTVLDALADAGDMTMYGVRESVLLVREEDGKLAYHRLDLTDSKLMESPYFYLKQNDALYVEPNKAKSGQSDYSQNDSYKLSVVSTCVSGISVIVSLIIALCR